MKEMQSHVPDQSSHAPTEASQSNADERWLSLRKPLSPANFLLDARTFRWLLKLPKLSRPMQLSWQFPRIANRFAKVWKDQNECQRYFEELLNSRRDSRRGFPAEIVQELTALQQYFQGAANNP